ncbi:MAG TPA: ATP-binding protein [Firmicutes bacterium]|nr:ATP-binding protein [Bacillota bacterium]
MKTVFEMCLPRPEVLSGELHEASFAARLGDVVRGTADPVYADPAAFFSRTHPTEGLRTLLTEALGRVWGTNPMAAPVLRMETGFGGGKTHSLIALYHAASGRVPAEVLAPYVGGNAGAPREGARVAVVVGDDLNPVDGIRHPDGTVTYTPWGEIAYQLGGRAAYEQVRGSDEARVPGAIPWREIIGEGPVVILLDELAPYLRTLRTWRGRETLAGHLAPFLKTLLEAVAASPRAVCVLTLAEASDAFGEETEELGQVLTQLIAELKAISGRIERILTPTSGEEEIARILARQLFERVDTSGVPEIAAAYRAYFEEAQRQGAELPASALTPDYLQFLERSYPFHPELLVTLNRKVSTIPNFQRTRGALRLLARAIRRLWEIRPADAWLIHPHHLDLSWDPIVEDLTSRLDRPRYKEVVHADIASPVAEHPGFASEIDRVWQASGRRPFAKRAATAIFLHSLTRGPAIGARTEEVNLACLAPGDDPALLSQALKELERRCWYLEYEGERWRFLTEPSLNKMVVDEMQYVGVTRGKQVLDERLRAIWQSGVFDVRRFPAEPAEIPDDAGKPKLAIVHYDAAAAREDEEAPPPLVRRLFQEKGTVGEPRTFQNNVLFLVCDEAQKEDMITRAREAEAVRRLADNSERQRLLTPEQRKRLQERKDESELQLRVAIHRAYRFLYYPSADAPRPAVGLAREALPAQDQGEVNRDQSRVILDVLRRLEKVYTGDDRPIAPELIKRWAWTHGAREMPVAEVMRAFAMRRGLRVLLDPRPLREGILQGVRRGLWVYYDPAEGRGYGDESPTPLVRLDGDAVLLEPELARERGIPIAGAKPQEEHEERCPVCVELASRCRCQAPPPPPPKEALEASGTAQQALQGILDRMHDRNVAALAVLQLAVDGDGSEGVRELRSLGLAVPQLGPGQFRVEVSATGELEGGSIRLEFRGPWERYKDLKDAVVSVLERASAAQVRARLDWRARDPLTPEGINQVRDVLAHLIPGRVRITAEPATGEVDGS